MAIIKGLFILIIVLAIMGGAIVGSYLIAQDNPFDGRHKHELSLVDATEPTCDTPGITKHYACSGCNGIFGDENGYVSLTPEDILIASLGHSWLDASCGEARTCEYCDATDGAAQAHKPGSSVKENIVPATCISEGSYDSVVYCVSCGEKISSEAVVAERKSHTPGSVIKENVKAATCYANGSYENVVFCAVDGCGAEMSRTVVYTDKLAHTPAATAVKENEKNASCFEAGSYDNVIYCTVENCSAVISKESKIIPALGHSDANLDAKCDNSRLLFA